MTVTFAALSTLMLGGCTSEVILYKPSPYIDPMPMGECNRDSFKSGEKDPRLEEQWHLARIGITEDVLNSGLLEGNSNVRVVVASTGIDYNHPELRCKAPINFSEISQKGLGNRPGGDGEDTDKNGLKDDIVGFDVVDNDGLAYDHHGAGTAAAGVIAARQRDGIGVVGIIQNVSLYPVRYIDDNGQTTLSHLVKALEVSRKFQPHVIFLQTGYVRVGGDRQSQTIARMEIEMLRRELLLLQKRNIIVVFGSGEDLDRPRMTMFDDLYKQFDNVVIVTGTTQKDVKSFLAADNIMTVATAAPAESILTLKPYGQYGTVDGTPYAAAQVVGALALARSILGDRMDYKKVLPVLMSGQGGDQLESLISSTRGATRLNIPKFLSVIQRM